MKKFLIPFSVIIMIGLSLGYLIMSTSDIPIGTYILNNSNNEVISPYVELKENNEFLFMYSTVSSYLPIGTYKIKDDILTLATRDKKNTYVFKIENGSLVFQADLSSEIPQYNGWNSVIDGDIFIYTEKQ